MPTLTLAAPTKPVDTHALRHELATALGIPAPYVDLHPDRLEIVGMVEDSMQQAAAQVVAAHVVPAPQPSLAERLAAVEARLDKAANAAVTGEAAKLRDGLKPGT